MRHDAARGVFDALIPELVRLARARPGDRFVVRPHPFERADVYRERFADLPNVVVDPAGEVMPALAAARAVIHVNCGTSVEAIMIGTPLIIVNYANNDAARGL